MSENTVYLVTGANRGLGYAFVSTLLSRPSTTVIAATRDPSAPISQALKTLSTAANSSLILVKIDSAIETDPAAAIKTIEIEHGITKLDVVIANSGIIGDAALAAEISPKVVREVFEVNVIGPLVLFQASLALLKKAAKPKFVVIGSVMGSVELSGSWEAPVTGYGSSKAAVHYITRRIHAENPDIIAFPIHPGWVQTEMGNGGAKMSGLEEAPQTIPESIEGVLKEIDEAENKDHTKLAAFDHTTLPW